MPKGCLNPCCGGRCSSTDWHLSLTSLLTVLILVVVEDVLVPSKMMMKLLKIQCLNPCCGGRCSSTLTKVTLAVCGRKVLILVVVEDVLVLLY